MKKYVLILLVCFVASAAKAQIGYNYAQYDFGLGVTQNKFFNDYTRSVNRHSFLANFTYNQTPFVNFVAELQVGAVATDTSSVFFGSLLNFSNDYTSLAFKAQVQAGEIMDYSGSQFANFFKNFYLSAGVGVMYNHFKFYESGFMYEEQKNSNVFIPVKLGYEIKFFNSYNEPTVKLDLGYQLNYMLSDNYDTIPFGRFNDAIGQFAIGLKIGIGGGTSYHKSINY